MIPISFRTSLAPARSGTKCIYFVPLNPPPLMEANPSQGWKGQTLKSSKQPMYSA